jgi:F0F1-type ATP synthase membrane subunit c/vacuolar-type H+-ATPase subunit K
MSPLFILILYTSGILSIAAVIIVVLLAQTKAIKTSNDATLNQPYSSAGIRKNLVITLSVLETPIIFSSIGIALAATFIGGINDIRTTLTIVSYFITIASVGAFTAYACSKPAKSFLNAISAHPQYEGAISQKLIILLSLLQTPLLFTLITIWIHLNLIKNADLIGILTNERLFLSACLCITMGISVIGVLNGLTKLMNTFSSLGIYFQSSLKPVSANLFFMLGLIETPVIFPFLIQFLNTKLLNGAVSIAPKYIYTLSILYIMFSLGLSYVAYKSGDVASKGIELVIKNKNLKKNIFPLSLIAQILLDARTIYIFVIIFLCILKLKIF